MSKSQIIPIEIEIPLNFKGISSKTYRNCPRPLEGIGPKASLLTKKLTIGRTINKIGRIRLIIQITISVKFTIFIP